MTAPGQATQVPRGRLHLAFRLGADRYAIDAREIEEVLPLRPLKRVPEAPAWIAGVLSHGSRPVPVIDLSARTQGRPAVRRMSTRLVLVRYPLAAGGFRTLGLVLERASETIRLDVEGFADYGLGRGAAAYLGPVQDAAGLVQRVEVAGLLPDDVRALLFPASDSGPGRGGA